MKLKYPALLAALCASTAQATEVFINEIHYDNTGADSSEFVEVVAPENIDLTGYQVELYNGSNGTVYATLTISAQTVSDGYRYATLAHSGIQNGAPDGMALSKPDGTVIQFLSYEGSMTATAGNATGLTSEDIGVLETSSTEVGYSLQLAGTLGSQYSDFTWQVPAIATAGALNNGQTFVDNGTGGETDPGDTDPGDGGEEGDTGTTGQAFVIINEIHYDNAGADVGEAIEVAGIAGTDLSGMSLVLYNGSNGTSYNTIALSGVLTDQANGFGTLSFAISGIQNGSPDGIALIDSEGGVLQFLSYEGTLTATDGPADTLESTDIGVEQTSSTSIGHSLQLTGTGFNYEDFTWAEASSETFDEINAEQVFVLPVPFINEIHYDNAGTDVDEGIELAGLAGIDLSGMTLALYNGSNGTVYNTVALSGVFADQENGFGTLSFAISGIQNGAPDAIALVDAQGVVLQFLSYEGTLTGTDGPAVGLQSTDIGVAETSSTSVGSSLQLTGTGVQYSDFVWNDPATSTFDAINNDQTFGTVDGDGDGDGGGDGGGEEPEPIDIGACLDTATFIHEVQGSGAASPMLGNTVVIEGVVTAVFQGSGQLGGFFIQEEDNQVDADPTTSEGVFVYDTSNLVEINDLVRLQGSVAEYYEMTQVQDVTALLNCGPAGSSVSASILTLPLNSLDEYEQVEGMSVAFSQPLTVTEYFNLDRYGQIMLSDERTFQFTHNSLPDATGYAQHLANKPLNQILLDDGSTLQNPETISYFAPTSSASNTLRGGSIANITGVMSYSFGAYAIQPVDEIVFTDVSPRTEAPAELDGNFKVAGINVLNYFTTLDAGSNKCGPSNLDCRGAENAEEFTRQRDKTIAAISIMDADVLGLVEIENNATESLSDLVSGLNDVVGAGTYAYVNTGTIGTDAIKVGVIYKPASATPKGAFAILDSSVDPLFLDNKNRPVLAQSFTTTSGEVFTVAVNHLKSKGSACDSDGDYDANDGQGNCAGIRANAATALVNWLATDPTSSGDDDFLILGDLNAYAMEDAITNLTDAGYTNLISAFGGPEAYSYVFDGELGYLDHALASASLTEQVTGVTEWHINSDEPDAFDYNTDYRSADQIATWYSPDAYRMSDHDPVIIGFDFEAAVVVVEGDVNGDGNLDMNDYYGFIGAYGSSEGDAAYNAAADMNSNGIIDMTDFQLWYQAFLAQ